ncbi:coiled-coil domain-containing protein [Vibrio splendidus]|uniref:hypothetical protein n=1 Tax=Vibrio splendidus TaxID=29497 RepID=UPI002235F090|nr:hypothetical protein [Vibrio splendidus]MCW4441072.1 hypothetical protein [Vibrio splendidus]
MDLFGVKNDLMKELKREKDYLWEGVKKLESELKIQKQQNDFLLREQKELQGKLQHLKKSAPSHYKEIERTSTSVATLRTRIKSRTEELKEYLEDAEQGINSIRDITASAEELKTLIDSYESDLANTNDVIKDHNISVKDRLDAADEALGALDDLLAKKEDLESDIQSISENNDESLKLFNSIKTLRVSAIKERNEIETAYDEVFGYDSDEVDDEGEPVRVKGKIEALEGSYKKIENELKRYYDNNTSLADSLADNIKNIEQDYNSKFEEYVDSCSGQHEEIVKRINKLLPTSLTAGLASAYDKKVTAESSELRRHDQSFKLAISLLIAVSLVPALIPYFYQNPAEGLLNFNEVVDRIKSLAPYMLPLYTPVLWLAYSANKKYKLSKRLIEEYTHKGVLSKTFEGLSEQIQNTSNQAITEELRTKLLYNLVDVNSENPGKLISDYNKSDHPLMDALDKSSKLADSVAKLARVPGFSALATHLDSKAKTILEAEDKKINAVFTSENSEKEQKNNPASVSTIQ